MNLNYLIILVMFCACVQAVHFPKIKYAITSIPEVPANPDDSNLIVTYDDGKMAELIILFDAYVYKQALNIAVFDMSAMYICSHDGDHCLDVSNYRTVTINFPPQAFDGCEYDKYVWCLEKRISWLLV